MEATDGHSSSSGTDPGLRILIATRCVVPVKPGHGGAELAAYEVARTLALRGHRITLVADAESEPGPGAAEIEWVLVDSRLIRAVRRLPGRFGVWMIQHALGNLLSARAVRRLTRERRFDVVHTHGSLSTVLVSRFVGPIIYTEHDAPPWRCRYRRWWERIIRTATYRLMNVTAQRRADRVVAVFEEHGIEMRERWRARNVTVMRNAADPEAFVPNASRRRRVRGEAATSNGDDGGYRRAVERRRYAFDRYCLYVGELSSRKAPDVLLRALVEAPDVPCVIVGDGPMRTHLEQLADRLGIAERVAFLGRQNAENLARIYSDAALLVHPTVSDTSPMVIVEAMATGTPVVATRIAGIPELVREGETGFLVDPEDVAGLAAAIRSAMASDGRIEEMGRRAWKFVREALTWSDVATQYEEAYLSVIPAERRRGLTARSPAPTVGTAQDQREPAPRLRMIRD